MLIFFLLQIKLVPHFTHHEFHQSDVTLVPRLNSNCVREKFNAPDELNAPSCRKNSWVLKITSMLYESFYNIERNLNLIYILKILCIALYRFNCAKITKA